MNETLGLENVFEDRERNLAAPNRSATSVLLASLRRNYPDCDVTLTSAHSTPLRPFAEAGHATATLDTSSERLVQNHGVVPVYRRVSRDPGKVVGRVTFGRYDYTWKSHSYIVFFAECPEMHNVEDNYFILAKRGSSDEKGTTPKAVTDLIAAAAHWNIEPHDEIFVFDQQTWIKDSELYKSVMSSSWDDVILSSEMKNTLVQDVEGFFDNKEAYEEFAVPWKRGLIFHGTPGNGKTISLKALMKSLYDRADPVPTLYVKSLAGCSNEFYAIRLIFDKARRTAPCILIFEDLDSLIKTNVKSFFLNEVDGLEDNNGLLMIGSTNYLDRLDPGISKRPSRFDRKYHFALPAKSERAKYCRFWQQKLEKNAKVDFPEELCDAIAQITEGFSFAYLKEAFVTALLLIVGAKKSTTNGIDDVSSPPPPQPVTDTKMNGEAEPKEGVDELTAEETDPEEKAANEKADKVLDGSLLGRVIRKQIGTLQVEMEEARKSVEESEKNAGQAGSSNDGTVSLPSLSSSMHSPPRRRTPFGSNDCRLTLSDVRRSQMMAGRMARKMAMARAREGRSQF